MACEDSSNIIYKRRFILDGLGLLLIPQIPNIGVGPSGPSESSHNPKSTRAKNDEDEDSEDYVIGSDCTIDYS